MMTMNTFDAAAVAPKILRLVLNNQSLLYILLCTLGSCDAPRAVKVPV